jgi:hypothetical protein
MLSSKKEATQVKFKVVGQRFWSHFFPRMWMWRMCCVQNEVRAYFAVTENTVVWDVTSCNEVDI